MDFKEQLLLEKQQLTEKLEAVNKTLKAYGFDAIGNIATTYSREDVNFPKNESREKRIYWLLEHQFKRAVKLPELLAAYKAHTGTIAAMDNLCRIMKKEGKLCYVKYNGKNKLCYWGMPDWVSIIDGKDFEEQYKPNDGYVDEIISSEIIKG